MFVGPTLFTRLEWVFTNSATIKFMVAGFLNNQSLFKSKLYDLQYIFTKNFVFSVHFITEIVFKTPTVSKKLAVGINCAS